MNNILNTFLKNTSKSLTIINEVIPIYKDTYPIIKKIKNNINKNNKNNKNNTPNKKELDNNSNPKFFL